MKRLFPLFAYLISLICLHATEDSMVQSMCTQAESYLTEGDSLLQPFDENRLLDYQTLEDAILHYRQANNLLMSFLKIHTDLTAEQKGLCKRLYAAIKEKSAKASNIHTRFMMSVVFQPLMDMFYENTYPLNVEDLQSLVSIHEILQKEIPPQLQQTIACLKEIGLADFTVADAASLSKTYPLAKLSLAIYLLSKDALMALNENPDFKERLIALRLIIQFYPAQIDLSSLKQLRQLELISDLNFSSLICFNLSNIYLSKCHNCHLICANSTHLQVNKVGKITCPNLITLEIEALPQKIEASDLPKLEAIFVKEKIIHSHISLPCLKYLLTQERIIQSGLFCPNLKRLVSTENSQTELYFPNSTSLEISGGWSQCSVDFSNVETLFFETKVSCNTDFRSLRNLKRLLINAPNTTQVIIPRNAVVDEHSTLKPDCKITFHWGK